MADIILNHPFDLNQHNNIHSLHFTSEQWQQFWQMQIVGATMAECLNSLKNVVFFAESTATFTTELSAKWLALSQSLQPLWESERQHLLN